MSYLDEVIGPPAFRFAFFQFHIVIWTNVAILTNSPHTLMPMVAIALSSICFFAVAIGEAYLSKERSELAWAIFVAQCTGLTATTRYARAFPSRRA